MKTESDIPPKRKPRLVRRGEKLPRRWRVRLPDGSLKGPYHETHIQDLLYYNNLPMDCEVAAVDSEDWYRLREHPQTVLFLGNVKSVRLASERNFQTTPDRGPRIDVRETLRENLRIELENYEQSVWVKGRARRKLRVFIGGCISAVLFAAIGLGVAWFFFEDPSRLHYTIAGIVGAVVGIFYARSRSGDLTNWQ